MLELVEVKAVYDGDTLRCATEQGETFLCRARWIDSPETAKGQSSSDPTDLAQWHWGKIAQNWLTTKLSNQSLWVIRRGVDSYNRVLADWLLRPCLSVRSCVQVQLVQLGFATTFLPFEQQYAFSDWDLMLYTALLKASIGAYRQQMGFWSDDQFTLPYQWKREHHS